MAGYLGWNSVSFIRIGLAVALMLAFVSSHGATPLKCSTGTWMACAMQIENEVVKNRDYYLKDPKAALALGAEWDRVFQAAYLRLAKQPRSESDLAQVRQEIEDKLNPANYVKDKALESLVKKYLPRLAPVLEVLASAPVAALSVFLTPSQIASDLDILLTTNKEVQARLWDVLLPAMKPDWRKNYLELLKSIPPPGPVIGPRT